MKNLITDVAGILVGSAHDARLASGVTVVLFEEPMVASVSVSGGAPAGRDLECLAPEARVERIDAITLSGGSAFGLDAASGAQAWLREHGRGLAVRERARADRAASHLLRLAQRRRQELGSLSALSRARLRGLRKRSLRADARQRGRGLRRDDRESQGRPRLGERAHAFRPCRCGARGGQRHRLGGDRRRPAFLGGALRRGR